MGTPLVVGGGQILKKKKSLQNKQQFYLLFSQGGFEYKKAIVDCIISIVEENPESKEAGLAHLCEFIEDCEHTVLATKILHLLGKEGPRTPVPSKYIRFIFNRVVLENEAVRAGESLEHN